ncbi:MAG: GntR family transcriptional regulator, partial [Lentisphaeria bacterium]|nr:GntR family transcriptional regulator [Lentisphaeria bacterium]
MFDVEEIKINKELPESLHTQLYRELVRLLREQHPETSGILPSERALCTGLGIHRVTVHKVYAALESSGIVKRRKDRAWVLCRSARKKLEGQVPSIGILLPSLFSEYTANWRRLEYLRGVIDRAAVLGYAVLMIQLPSPESTQEEIGEFISSRLSGLSGVIHLGNRISGDDPVLAAICRYTGIPQVCISGHMEGYPHIGAVFCGFSKAAEDMSGYLKSLGVKTCGLWRKIPVFPEAIGGKPEFHYAAKDREDLMKHYLKKVGISVPDEWDNGDVAFEKSIFPKLKKGNLPDLVWCCSDDAALKLWAYCKKKNIRVPEDMKI